MFYLYLNSKLILFKMRTINYQNNKIFNWTQDKILSLKAMKMIKIMILIKIRKMNILNINMLIKYLKLKILMRKMKFKEKIIPKRSLKISRSVSKKNKMMNSQ